MQESRAEEDAEAEVAAVKHLKTYKDFKKNENQGKNFLRSYIIYMYKKYIKREDLRIEMTDPWVIL